MSKYNTRLKNIYKTVVTDREYKLQDLIVNRVSTGSRPMMFLLNHFRKLLHQVKIENIPNQLFSNEITYNEINSWFL